MSTGLGLDSREAVVANVAAAEPAVSSNLLFLERSSSTGEIYHLEAMRTGNSIRFTCSCQAGGLDRLCKHWMAILLNDTRSCIDVDKEALVAFHDMIKGSRLIEVVEMVAQAEGAVAEAQDNLKRAQRLLAAVLNG